MPFSMSRAWSDAFGLVRERWVEAGAIALGIAAASTLIMLSLLPLWVAMLMPDADPQLQTARLQEHNSRLPAMSTLSGVIQLAGYCMLVALFRRDRPALGKAIVDGLLGTLPVMISVIFLAVAAYIGMFIMIFMIVAVGVLSGIPYMQVEPSYEWGLAVGLMGLAGLGVFLVVMYFAARFATLLPVVVNEGLYNPFSAIARSWRLTRGNGAKIFGFLLLVWFVMLIVQSAILGTFGWPLLTSFAAGQFPSIGLLLLFGLAITVTSVVVAMITCAVPVAIHGQLAEEPPA